MAIIDQKSKIFGNIAATRTISEGLPKLITNPSFPSINNESNSMAFLTDLLKALVGVGKLRDIIVDTLSNKLDDVEIDIKNVIKESLMELVNCGVNPSIPAYIKSGGSGVKIEVKKIDFFNVLKANPNTSEGKLLYTDITTPLTSSTDFNTFLYGTIQNEGQIETWGSSPIMDIKFNSTNTGTNPNNTLTFNANSNYDNKSLRDFNNNYIDSIDLFDSAGLLNKILDDIFGCVSIILNKTNSQLKKEEEIKMIVDNIVNSDENAVINDEFFKFSSEEVAIQEEKSGWRKKGISMVTTTSNSPTTLPLNVVSSVNTDIKSALTSDAKNLAISGAINDLGKVIKGQALNAIDSYALELNFIEDLIKNIVKSMVGFVLSPKIISIFLINYKIIYGQTSEYTDAIDFMKKNRNLIKVISKTIRNVIIKLLLTVVLKEILKLVAETAIEIQTEKAKNKVSQTLSLVGIPSEVLRLIKGL